MCDLPDKILEEIKQSRQELKSLIKVVEIRHSLQIEKMVIKISEIQTENHGLKKRIASLERKKAIICAPVVHNWTYKEQGKWPEPCQSALLQSPIDLDERSMVLIDLEPFSFKNWDQEYEATMLNNGHSVYVEISSSQPLTVTGGGLPGLYKLAQFHFHWGSEHTQEGKRLALESHFVTYNSKYKSLDEAIKYRGAVAVFGVLYEESQRQNDHFNSIVKKIPKIQKVNQKIKIKINPSRLLPREVTRFYRYDGSLTTPSCNDVVIWTIFSEVLKISREQVEEFASIRDKENKVLSANFRAIQPLNGRTVYVINTDEYRCT